MCISRTRCSDCRKTSLAETLESALALELRRNGGSLKSFTRFFPKNRGSGEGRALSQAPTSRTSETAHSFATDNEACAAPQKYSKNFFDKLNPSLINRLGFSFSDYRCSTRSRISWVRPWFQNWVPIYPQVRLATWSIRWSRLPHLGHSQTSFPSSSTIRISPS